MSRDHEAGWRRSRSVRPLRPNGNLHQVNIRIMQAQHIVFAAALSAMLLIPASAPAQEKSRCLLLCAPELSFEPTLTFSDLFRRTAVLDLRENRVSQVESSTAFEMILAMGIPTTIPRVGLTIEAIWAPFGKTSGNPFTGYGSEDLGTDVVENPVELEFELNTYLLQSEQTAGWVEAHFDVVDKFSPAEKPGDERFYTHKLDFELDVAVSIFNGLPEGNWLRNLEVEGSLDYLATGLPRRGDEVPKGEQRYLDDASPWSFSILLVVPIAPLQE